MRRKSPHFSVERTCVLSAAFRRRFSAASQNADRGAILGAMGLWSFLGGTQADTKRSRVAEAAKSWWRESWAYPGHPYIGGLCPPKRHRSDLHAFCPMTSFRSRRAYRLKN
jgi:hypothetical protein